MRPLRKLSGRLRLFSQQLHHQHHHRLAFSVRNSSHFFGSKQEDALGPASLTSRPTSSLGSLNFPHVAPGTATTDSSPSFVGVALRRSSFICYTSSRADPLADRSIFDEINAFSQKRQTGVSLKTLLDTGSFDCA